MGRTPVSAADYAASVATLNVDASQQQALLSRDHAALNALLDGRAKMHCFVVAADEQA